jgi:hypothetical protein
MFKPFRNIYIVITPMATNALNPDALGQSNGGLL